MSKLASKLYVKGLMAKEKLSKLWKNEQGEANIIAIILVLAIVIALALVFKSSLTALFNRIWSSLFTKAEQAL